MKYYVYEKIYDFFCEYEEKHTEHNMLCRHYHESYEIFMLVDGERYIFFNDRMHRLEEGDIVILKPYTLHYSESRESKYYKRYVMNFSDDMLKNILSEEECKEFIGCLHSGVIHLNDEKKYIAKKYFDSILSLSKKNDRLSKKLLSAKVMIFVDMLKGLWGNAEYCDEYDIVCSHGMVDVLNYINSHFNKELSLEFIVKYAHMSKSNFCRAFKAEMGTTFLRHLNNLRVAQAHSLLVNTDKSIQKISEETGFSSLLHFERVFKTIHGVSPEMKKAEISDISGTQYVYYDETTQEVITAASDKKIPSGTKIISKGYYFTVTPNDETITKVKVTDNSGKCQEKTLETTFSGNTAIVFGILAQTTVGVIPPSSSNWTVTVE